MPLPEPILDDLRFQRDLVDEARRRIIRYCPEWTDYNLSDPGITLIELFAWMTEMMVYRLNRVPEKNYIKFMDLLGVQLQPASSARTELTFRLSAPFPISDEGNDVAIVPQGTEVSTRRTEEEEEVTFTTDERLVLRPPQLIQLRRDTDFNKNYLPRLHIEGFYAFQRRPKPDDAFYLGFDPDEDISGHILRLTFACRETEATGIKRDDPPLVWECSLGDGRWFELELSNRPGERDTTGGLNNAYGQVFLYLPLSMAVDEVHSKRAYWIRCRVHARDKSQGMYTESPRLRVVQAHTYGATTWATHAILVRDYSLGISSGEPGQLFQLEHRPILALRDEETVEVEERRNGELVFVPWKRVDNFSDSDRHDRHFTIDNATGEIRFGPSVRQPDGSMRAYGRVPEAGRRVRVTQYRHGGGMVGNVPIGKLQVMKSSLPYVDQVTNLKRAEGGRDPEGLEEAKMRTRREMRAQQRAVTSEDFENLGQNASRSIARIKCNTSRKGGTPLPPGMVELLVVPAAADALRAGDLSRLELVAPLRREVETYLDRFRLLSTTLRVSEPRYIGVKVWADIVVGEYNAPELVRPRVAEALRNFLSPLPLGAIDELPASLNSSGKWEGWPFGRDLYVSEIYSLLQLVPGVKHVLDVRVARRHVIPDRERSALTEEGEERAADPRTELIPLSQRVLEVPGDSLLCSLDHEITVVEL